jgi:2-polyprenyl-3-methyl-5-hydroxy-6-metoxy-1,4-benzoquinol methylase
MNLLSTAVPQIQPPDSSLTTLHLVRLLKTASASLQGLSRLKTHYRPYICPLNWILAQIPSNASLLDTSCVTGSLLYLTQQLRHVTIADGYDIVESVVQDATVFQKVSETIQIHYRPPDAPLPDLSAYTTITMIDVLHHIPPNQQDAFLYELIDRMPPGSRLIVKDIEASQYLGAWSNQIHDLLLARQWVHPRRAVDIAQQLRNAGAAITPPMLLWTLWYPHFLLVAEKPK